MQQVADIFTGRTHIMVDVTAEDDPSLSTDTKGALDHITQAVLNNVAKHSTAGRVPIMLQEAGPRYAFRIQGDGQGSERGS